MTPDTTSELARILLIEDDAADAFLIRLALDPDGFPYELATLNDGAEALFVRRKGDAQSSTQPDLIVMDLHLPKHEGIEILEPIRETVDFLRLPVVSLSSVASPREKNSVALNASCFVAKPFNLGAFFKFGDRIKELALTGRNTARELLRETVFIASPDRKGDRNTSTQAVGRNRNPARGTVFTFTIREQNR
jgi:CheY-like chemotaxis protein